MLDGLDGTAEVILVDDGSTDGSFEQMLSFHERDERFKVVRLSRNFGHQIALTAGLDHARGNAVVMMDADLQDPPEVALELAKRWREGYAVVYAVRERAGPGDADEAGHGEGLLPVAGPTDARSTSPAMQETSVSSIVVRCGP